MSGKLDLTNSVDVVFAVVGIVIVDNKLDVVHIKSSGSDVGGDEDGGAASLELAKHPLPLLLLLVPMDAHRWPTVFPHQPFQDKHVRVMCVLMPATSITMEFYKEKVRHVL